MTNESDITRQEAGPLASSASKSKRFAIQAPQFNLFFEMIHREIEPLVKAKYKKEGDRSREMACYDYILSKHRTLLFRRLRNQILSMSSTDKTAKALSYVKKNLENEVKRRMTALKAGLQGHPDEVELLKKLTDYEVDTHIDLDKTPDIIMEIEGKLGFRLEYDSSSLFTQAAYNNLENLYEKILINSEEISEADLRSGAKSVANYMVNQSLSIEPLDTSEKNNPIAEYQDKLQQAKRDQYQILKRTFLNMTEKTRSSYRKDFADDLLNIVVPDSEVISQFSSTSFRNRGKNPIDLDLHRIFVLLMECDTKTGNLSKKLLQELQQKYFSLAYNADDLSPEQVEENIKNCLSELVASLADVLNEQMDEREGSKKPLLTKHLNNLLKKYNHPYRIGKKNISPEGTKPVFRLAMVRQKRLTAETHFIKNSVKPGTRLYSIVVDVLLGLSAAAVAVFFTGIAFSLLPFAVPIAIVAPLCILMGIFSAYVNYKLYHKFVKPTAILFMTAGPMAVGKMILDKFIGEKAPLNIFKRGWDKLGKPAKIALSLTILPVLAVLAATLVIGFCAIVSIGTFGAAMSIASSIIGGMPLLMIGAALTAGTAVVLAFIAHIPLILLVTAEVIDCVKIIGQTIVDLVRGNEKDSLGKRIARFCIIAPLVLLASFVLIPLTIAGILTVVDFKNTTVQLGRVLRTALNAPKSSALAVLTAITSIPGMVSMGVSGFLQFAKNKLISLKNRFFPVKQNSENSKAAVAVRQSKTSESDSDSDNPYVSSFHIHKKKAKPLFDALALGGNSVGTGLTAGVAAPNKKSGLAVTLVAALSSLSTCSLGFFGEDKVKIGGIGKIKDVISTHKALHETLKESEDSRQPKRIQAEENEPQEQNQEEIAPEEVVASNLDLTKQYRAFFEKRQTVSKTIAKRAETAQQLVTGSSLTPFSV